MFYVFGQRRVVLFSWVLALILPEVLWGSLINFALSLQWGASPLCLLHTFELLFLGPVCLDCLVDGAEDFGDFLLLGEWGLKRDNVKSFDFLSRKCGGKYDRRS